MVWSYGRWSRAETRQAAGPNAAPFLTLVGLSSLAVLLHVLMDFPTSYGTRLLSPFDWHWFAVDWLPIIDVYLLIALAAGLAFGHMTPQVRRHNIAIALVVMAGNYVLRGVAHERALALAPRLFGQTLPPPCGTEPATISSIGTWPRPPAVVPPMAADAWSSSRRCPRSCRRFNGASSRICRTRTRSTTSMCSIAVFSARSRGRRRCGERLSVCLTNGRPR